ncbi:MAG: glutamate--cysteine ligase [Gammaproteobacteria bacterium]|nr:glutamate--cysteine ligase [Gammaproteobacteria bacterium]MCW8988792.1 glutamate--cysteine ligase [Gammaproteobacteria bacterium]MCW9031754.1 glutamate--cysteine ligase [Gammaproteobacteria bacterium]
MYQLAEQYLKAFAEIKDKSIFSQSLIGLEKETLRVNHEGGLAQTPHPIKLGSALTHPYITTDYSEALLEIVTPPSNDIPSVLQFLSDTQHFIYNQLDDELLWATSMPCVVAGETSIPLAKYGSSNSGLMKTVYRRGLGHRYGRVMQVIAGVHFNFSFSEKFWPVFFNINKQKNKGSEQDLISESYFSLIRNLQRFGWLIPYLFGASPAVCKSFLQGKETTLSQFNETTYYEPYATSLRMGDIGYQNNKENEVGVVANYNSLMDYIRSLQHAIETPCPKYEKFGFEVDGQYQQLNSNILQIENEYYSTVRPKQITHKYEMPIEALRKRGVQYVELRSLDVNAFHPLGINEEQLYFLETFMLFCLVHESPPIGENEKKEIDQNEMLTAHQGRDPDLRLTRNGKDISIIEWGGELLDVMQGFAALLDEVHGSNDYSQSLNNQKQAINDPECTPSAKMLAEMRQNDEGFYQHAMRMSQHHHEAFVHGELSAEKSQFYADLASISLKQQKQIEENDTLSFATFLERYFAKSL